MMIKRLACAAVGVLALFAVGTGSAVAGTAVPAPSFSVQSLAVPSVFSAAQNPGCLTAIHHTLNPGETLECDVYQVVVRNVGGAASDGSPVTIVDTLPAGLAVVAIGLHVGYENAGPRDCVVTAGGVRCVFPEAVVPGRLLVLQIQVTVAAGFQEGAVNTVNVSGGGAAPASTSVQGAVGAVPFGVSAFSFDPVEVDDAPATQAGAHPNDLAAAIALDTVLRRGPQTPPQGEPLVGIGVQDVRDVVVDLPMGFVGSALAAPTCTLAQLTGHAPPEPEGQGAYGCATSDTRIGRITTLPTNSVARADNGLFNIAPEPGIAAQFGFSDTLDGAHTIDVGVAPSPAGYVLESGSSEIPQATINEILLDFFGDPAARDESSNPPVAQFTNPADCSGQPLTATIHMDSWQAPGARNPDGTPDLSDPRWVTSTATLPPVTGCDLLRFAASLRAQPETSAADSPTGFGVELQIPQSQGAEALGTPPLRDATVTLPVGMSVNPSAAGGLGVCSEAQIGWLGGTVSNFTASAPACPENSKIGSVEVETPALAGVLEGSIYLATQYQNPYGSLLAGYIVIDDPKTGVIVKFPGELTLDPVTGEIAGVFKEAPQFPLSDVRLRFYGGPRGVLTTPAGCGTYTTASDLMPWSAPDSGPDATPSDSFQISSGCSNAFGPAFSAGTVDNRAGAFSAFTTTFSRQPGEQNLAGVTLTTPPGLLGILKGVERCPEPQAGQGTCGPNSLIGHTTAAVGSGPDPFYVQGGRVFLTGPYKGAPFGLSIVVPAVAGPFNLGNVVVRAAIDVDPHTAQITVVSDPLPTILDGIPLDVRTVNVTIDRPSFMFNPTDCEALAVNGSLTSTQGATAQVSSHFQAANCANLPFHPVFSVSTQAKTSKHNGASLTVKTTFPTGPQANIHSVGVVLPKQLPARLTTIQQACPEAVFAANPASCPAGSDIGIGTATTPILTAPATGPAYLVSHGGAAFPDVDLVFQDEGVTLDLVGSVNIRHGITSSKFATVPDAPISSFQLSLPEGPHSGLAAVLPAKAKGNMCAQKLTMPFTITGQNGAVLNQNVKIAVTGCPKPKKAHKSKKAKGRKKG